MLHLQRQDLYIKKWLFSLIPLLTSITAGEVPESVLPDAYTGTATMEINYGPDDGGWKHGSQRVFSIANDWEFFTSELYQGPSLGYSKTTYNYSNNNESFRYDLQHKIKNVGLFPDGLIDRDLFISPKLGYELLARSTTPPVNNTTENPSIYKRKNPLEQNRDTFIAIDNETSQIQWIQTRFDDGATRTKFVYSEWEQLNTGGSIPHLIEYNSDTLGGIRVHITNIQLIDSTTTPPPNDLDDEYEIYNYKDMKIYDPEGNYLRKIAIPSSSEKKTAKQSTKRSRAQNKKQTLFIGTGILLVLISGVLISTKRVGNS